MADTTLKLRIDALVQAANAWIREEEPLRAELMDHLFGAAAAESDVFTEASCTYEINRFMHGLAPEHLGRIPVSGDHETGLSWCVRHPEGVDLLPLEFQVYAWIQGDMYAGLLEGADFSICTAFWASVAEHLPVAFDFAEEGRTSWEDFSTRHAKADRRIDLKNEEETFAATTMFEAVQQSHAIAVLDGRETDRGLEGVAEDLLLHDGRGIRTPQLIWAPKALKPDELLEVLAAFRATIPGHPTTPRRLKMQQAFLEARDLPHAFTEDLSFLLSKGEPEIQGIGHFRWVPYGTLDEVVAWCKTQAKGSSPCSLVVARSAIANQLDVPQQVRDLGNAHKPVPGQTSWANAFQKVRNLR